MAEVPIEAIRQYLEPLQGRIVELDKIRRDFEVKPEDKSWNGLRTIMLRLSDQKIVKPSGKKDGIYKVIKKVQPVKVFGTNHKAPPFELIFPRDFDTGREMEFSKSIVVRGGDLILIAGVSNYGKTAIALNFLAENIEKNPVLMGNEYTTIDGQPTPRFINRIEAMDWIDWVDEKGDGKFTLLPVLEDYAENIVEGRINIVDWINIETGEHYMIGSILKDIKQAVGSNGVAIVVIQKAESADAGRGGQFTKDFADVELLIDKHTEFESRITVGKVKEYTSPVIGKSWAYHISKGVKLHGMKAVVKCHTCHGFKYIKGKGACDTCNAAGWLDK